MKRPANRFQSAPLILLRGLRNRRGFSLMELVVALMLATIAMAVLYGVFAFTNKLYFRTAAFNELNANAIQWVKLMEKNILFCKGIVSGSGKRLTLEKPDGKVGVLSWDGVNMKYNGTKIGNAKYNVSELEFTYFGVDSFARKGEERLVNLMDLEMDNDALISGKEINGLRMIKVSISFASKTDTCRYRFAVKNRGKNDLNK